MWQGVCRSWSRCPLAVQDMAIIWTLIASFGGASVAHWIFDVYRSVVGIARLMVIDMHAHMFRLQAVGRSACMGYEAG